jgi:hypothetical protein
MPKWMYAILLLIQAHFAASYLVPLDAAAQREFGGLLRWAWPWSEGDSGPLGQVTATSGVPFVGLILAAAAGGLLVLSVMALFGWWVPVSWWRGLAISGAVMSILLLAFFPGLTKLIPIAFGGLIIWLAFTERVAAGWEPSPGG